MIRALRGKNIKQLPVHLIANKMAWMTTNIFTNWFNNCFVPEIQKYVEEKGLEFKILLLVDNAPRHPVLEHINKIVQRDKQFATGIELHFLSHDPDVERALKFQRNFSVWVAGYREIYKQLEKPENSS